MPDSVSSTSMRGRSISSSGIKEAPARRPKLSKRGRAPSKARAWAIGPPSLFRLSVPPEHQGHGLRDAIVLGPVAGQHLFGLPRALADREGARDPERVEAMHVAARRQHGRGADEVAPGGPGG